MRYDFDKPIDRWGTDSIKYEMIREGGDARMDVLPMSIADMEFATPAPILDAMRRRLEHPVLGYSMPYDPAYGAAVSGWRTEDDTATILDSPGRRQRTVPIVVAPPFACEAWRDFHA